MCIEVELIDCFDYAESINIYYDGVVKAYYADGKEFEKILVGWKAMVDGAHDMPAFGVSLNLETLRARNIGVWVEFDFGKTHESNGMPYEKLLINVEKNSQGFNLIRYNSYSGYDGRCFYYDLVGNDMSNFYEILIDL